MEINVLKCGVGVGILLDLEPGEVPMAITPRKPQLAFRLRISLKLIMTTLSDILSICFQLSDWNLIATKCLRLYLTTYLIIYSVSSLFMQLSCELNE